MTFRKIGIFNIILVVIIAVFGLNPWYFLMLTVAQLIFVPLTLEIILKNDTGWLAKYLSYLAVLASLAIFLLELTAIWAPVLAGIYFAFTIMIATYGLKRLFNRGFIHFEAFLIDIGLIYVAIGGAWFLASAAKIDTGFSPMITWLTGIHFHYSAFLLPIFVGLLGRIYKSASYQWIGSIIILSPIIVALGITFSVTLELVSVLIYIVGIYGLIVLSFKAPIQHAIQKICIRVSFAALGISIIFSLLYAFGNLSGLYIVTIDFMLLFHGITNVTLFALVGIIGWSIETPTSKQRKLTFPISQIRGKMTVGEKVLSGKRDDKIYTGLIDNMAVYEPDIDLETLSPVIIDFYENTNKYRLFASIKWRLWFIPFTVIYRLISRYVKQLNLPLSSKEIEMTGDILSVQDSIDGRTDTRAWIRKVKNETIFVALYAAHKSEGRTYNNIALPLPGSSMIGILQLSQMGQSLNLTSKRKAQENSDAGIYLTMGKSLFKLPIEEQFHVEEIAEGKLKAEHRMWIFSVPFLRISYSITVKGE